MTRINLLSAATLSLLLVGSGAHALTAVGEVQTISDMPEMAKQWQKTKISSGDETHWSYAERFARSRGLVEGSIDQSAETKAIEDVMRMILRASINAEVIWGKDINGYPTFIAGQYVFLPDIDQASGAVLTEQSTPEETAESLVAYLNQRQADLAAELVTLSESLSTLSEQSAEDVAGLTTRVEQISEQTQAIGEEQTQQVAELGTALSGLEEALLLLQNGELTQEILNTIQSRIDASLAGLTADIAALQRANIEFGEQLAEQGERIDQTVNRVDDFEQRLNGSAPAVPIDVQLAQTYLPETAAARYAENLWLMRGVLGAALLLMVVLLGQAITGLRLRSRDKKINYQSQTVAAVQKKVDDTNMAVNSLTQRVDQAEAESQTTRTIAEGAGKLAATVRDDLGDLVADVDSMQAVKAADIEPAEGNLSPKELAALQPGEEPVEQLYHCQDNIYQVTFWRDEATPDGSVLSNIHRWKKGEPKHDELLSPISVKKLNGRLAAAISSGRLRSMVNA